jgi:hypothetical protein
MNRVFATKACLLACTALYGGSAGPVRLPQGTPVRLKLEKALSSADAHAGDRVEFRVQSDVSVEGVIAIPKGSPAWGVVTDASPRARMARSGRLRINIEAVCAGGARVPLRAFRDTEQLARRKAEPEASAADTLLAFPAWPILMFLYGKDVVIAKGTETTAYLNAETEWDPAKLAAGAAAACTGAPGPGKPAGEAALVSVRSNPDGAEIRVDGRFMGNTPSSLRLDAGDHKVALAMPGHAPWGRTVTIGAGGEITVLATLEPAPSEEARQSSPAVPPASAQ